MGNAKACSTPLATGKNLSKEEGKVMRNPTSYRQIIGSISHTHSARYSICCQQVDSISSTINFGSLASSQKGSSLLKWNCFCWFAY